MRVEYVSNSPEWLVVEAARASFNKEASKYSDEANEKLIKYLATHKHYLPFRHPQLTLRCTAPIFVARQLAKHQIGFSWSEESRRYVTNSPDFYVPEEWRSRPDGSIKQGSGAVIEDPLAEEIERAYAFAMMYAESTYTELLSKGVAPEMARMVLPVSHYTIWVWTGSLLAWADMVCKRLKDHSQEETRRMVELIDNEVGKYYPIAYPALVKSMWG